MRLFSRTCVVFLTCKNTNKSEDVRFRAGWMNLKSSFSMCGIYVSWWKGPCRLTCAPQRLCKQRSITAVWGNGLLLFPLNLKCVTSCRRRNQKASSHRQEDSSPGFFFTHLPAAKSPPPLTHPLQPSPPPSPPAPKPRLFVTVVIGRLNSVQYSPDPHPAGSLQTLRQKETKVRTPPEFGFNC